MNEKQDVKKPQKPTFTNFMELIIAVANAEALFKESKIKYEHTHNKLLLNINWNGVNEDREKQGLPKLGNQDMKNAFIDEQLLALKSDLSRDERRYYDLKRKYDVALKYSFETLKVSL